MKAAHLDYVAVRSAEEAVLFLSESGGEARPIAGGQSLVPMLNFRLAAPTLLVDLNGISALNRIDATADGGLTVGALTRTRTLELSSLVRDRQPLLAEAIPHIAHLSIRNRGTLGGSLAHADPAAELPALAVALDARLILQSSRGLREVAAEDFFRGLFSTAARADEILTEIRFPPWPDGRQYGFQEFSRRRGDFAMAGIALWLDRADGVVDAARIVAFGVSDRPQRLMDAEAQLTGYLTGDHRAIERALNAARVAAAGAARRRHGRRQVVSAAPVHRE